MKFTPENITELDENQVFVFGSNLAGRHGKGAAKTAMKFGAIYGVAVGRWSDTYAIPTKDENMSQLSLSGIEIYVRQFLEHARRHPELEFLVTKIGCGLAGYTPKQIAPDRKSVV